MRVLYFGTYERDYPRNAQVISCLRRAGIDVVERHVGVWEGRRDSWRAGPATLARLASAELRLLRSYDEQFDALIVGYPGHLDLPAARRAAGGRPVVFNPLVSLADTFVADRGRFRPALRPRARSRRSTAVRSGPPTWSSPTPRPMRATWLSSPACRRSGLRSASSAPRSGSSSRGGLRRSRSRACSSGS
jgi:hypothetical protein